MADNLDRIVDGLEPLYRVDTESSGVHFLVTYIQCNQSYPLSFSSPTCHIKGPCTSYTSRTLCKVRSGFRPLSAGISVGPGSRTSMIRRSERPRDEKRQREPAAAIRTPGSLTRILSNIAPPTKRRTSDSNHVHDLRLRRARPRANNTRITTVNNRSTGRSSSLRNGML